MPDESMKVVDLQLDTKIRIEAEIVSCKVILYKAAKEARELVKISETIINDDQRKRITSPLIQAVQALELTYKLYEDAQTAVRWK